MSTITTTTSTTPTARAAARLSVACSGLFLAVLAALHLVKDELDPSWRLISEYEIGRNGWLMQSAFVVLAVGTVGTVLALRGHVVGRAGKAGLVLLLVAAAGMALAGFAVADPVTATPDEVTGHGNLHGLGALLGIPTFPVAAALVARGLSHSATWPGTSTAVRRATLAAWFGLAQFLVAMAVLLPANDGVFGPETPLGWPNRLLMVAYVGWSLTVAVQAGRLAEPEA